MIGGGFEILALSSISAANHLVIIEIDSLGITDN